MMCDTRTFVIFVQIFLLLMLHKAFGSYSSLSKNTILAGNPQPCQNEGEPVELNGGGMSCYRCICKNGFVAFCQEICPAIEDCYLQMPKSGCCVRCKGCWYNGTEYSSHSEWSEGSKVMRCEAGVITSTVAQCYVPCDNPVRTRHTHYNCPVCNDCLINGQRVMEGRDVTIPEDPCLKCRCSRGGLTCAKRACSVLACATRIQYTPPGECCPRCNGTATDRLLPSLSYNKPCIIGQEFHAHLSEFMHDSCTKCTCINGTSVCERNTCPVITCSPDVLMSPLPGKCCPTCPIVEEIKTACIIGDKTYQEGETWQLDACKSCRCHGGEPRCAMERCPVIVCATDQQLKRVPGQCCEKCVDLDGVCSVFGDPHYKTFDGKYYSFQGSCKYQLTGDCSNNTFSIRISNDARGSHRSSWTKTVALRTPERKITLGKRLRVKVDGKRVLLPYESEDGTAKVVKGNNTVIASVSLGLQLLWDGNGFLEVTVSSSYKGQLCGLCGNFNSIARDDLVARHGFAPVDPWKFGNSWRVGGKKACTRERERPARMKCNGSKLKKAKTLCRPFHRSDAFRDCTAKLNPQPYRQACEQDACECVGGSRCHCESYFAYARECERLGATPANWRSDAYCDGTGPIAFGNIGRNNSRRNSLEDILKPPARVPSADRARPPPPIHN